MALGIAQMSSIRSTISGHQSRTGLPYHLHWTTNLNQNCCEQDDADDDRGDDDDDDDNNDDDDDDDDDDVGFPTVGFPNTELISKLLKKISVRVDVSKSLKTFFFLRMKSWSTISLSFLESTGSISHRRVPQSGVSFKIIENTRLGFGIYWADVPP